MRLSRPVLGLALVAGLLASSPASAGGCRAASGILSRTPAVKALPGGAVMRTWDTLTTSNNQRVVAVTIPAGSALKGSLKTAGSLTRNATVGTMASQTPGAVVTVNGSYYDAAKGAIPTQPVMQNGRAVKGSASWIGVLAFDAQRKAFLDRVKVEGYGVANGHRWPVTGLNWQHVTGGGLNVWTADWGTARRPYGTVDVVLVGSKVMAVRTGTARGLAPRRGQAIVSAIGTTGAQLAQLKVGMTLSGRVGLVSEGGHRIVDAMGRGRRYLEIGAGGRQLVDGGSCGARDEQLRPRTAVAWKANGDLLVVTVSGRAVKDGVIYGGATVHSMPTYLKRLGAIRAVGLDGGGSTTMFVRSARSGSAYRVDRLTSVQRRVVNGLVWR